LEKLVACGYDFGGNLWVCKHLGLPDKIFKNLVDRHFLGCNLLICNKLEFYNEVQTELPVLDLLELYAVLYPTLYVSPSLIGMCNRFKIKVLPKVENQPILIFEILNHMLNDLKAFAMDEKQNIISILKFMASDGFLWSSYILKFLGEDFDNSTLSYDKKDVEALKVFKVLKEFDFSELEKIDNDCEVFSINEVDTVVKLKEINNIYKEKRESQTLYSLEATKIFNNDDVLNVACCEAGTGIGKTVGYLAPVLAFLEKNPDNSLYSPRNFSCNHGSMI
jgi:ATP-dependent DNA helicase DinG